MSVITIGSYNVEHDGWTSDGRGGGHLDKWYAAHEELGKIPFDILFRQEMTHSRENGKRLLFEAERMLAMRGFLAPSETKESPNPPGIFIRPDTFRVIGEWPQENDWWHAPCAIQVKFAEHSTPIHRASVHLGSRAPERRQIEARSITTWNRRNLAVIMGGDFNSYSNSGIELQAFPSWPDLLDRGHQEHRTRGGVETDTEPDRILTAVGLDDVAVHAARHLGQLDALAPTASLHPEITRRQGPRQRIDQQRVSRALLPALRSFTVVPLPFSDHALTYSVWDSDELLAGLERHPTFDYRHSTPV
ncbi:hypothetical protein AB0O82_13680 [Kitasatospora sp. NPDC088264]|uniref:endonuclease/exonuclease/phosphatase family protein n=1 Tax=Kitasatospora sp. NPDC088264 TaxID=3155296 RepID=UPI00342A8A25